MGLSETARLVAELTLDDKLTKGSKTALSSLGKLEKGVGRVGKGAGQVSSGLGRAGTKIAIGIGAGLAASAKAFIDWEDAFQGVVKTVDETDLTKAGLSFQQLSDDLRAMSLEMPNSAVELAGIAEQAGALGIKAKDIEAFTKQVAILASTTDVSADDAATALGQLQNVIGLTGDEFDNFAAALVDLGNKGASTESQILEIARRSGGAGKQIGLAADELLAFSSAAANLGIDPEAAGTNLSKLYGTLQLAFVKGSKTLIDITGKDKKALRKAFVSNPTEAMKDLFRSLSKLKGADRLEAITKIFGKNQVLRRLVNGLVDSLDQNLNPALEESATAWEDATAAQAEFDKRNATIKSSLSRLRNGVIDAAVTLGEGFAPAVGRAATKLADFLKQDTNRSELKKLGADIGDAIDSIDWQKVLDGAKTFASTLKIAFDWAKRIFDALNALPTEVKGAGLGAIALDKLSGGLIGQGLGNIVGGLGSALTKGVASKLPGVGRLIAQPVFVTNWPGGGLGGAGGGAGAGGGSSLLSKGLSIATIVGSVAAVIETQQQVSGASSAQASAIHETQDVYLKSNPTTDALRQSLAGVDQGIADLKSNPLNVLVQGDALTQLQAMRDELSTKLNAGLAEGRDKLGEFPGEKDVTEKLDSVRQAADDTRSEVAAVRRAADGTTTTVGDGLASVRERIEGARIAQVTATDQAKAAINLAGLSTATAARIAGYDAANATNISGARIVSALQSLPAPQVIVNVTASHVTQSQTTQKRSGNTGTSRERDPYS